MTNWKDFTSLILNILLMKLRLVRLPEVHIVDRMTVVLIVDHTMKVLCVVLMPGAEDGTQDGILWVDTLPETK